MFFNTCLYNNLMKVKTNMIILILLLQGTRSLTQDLVDFRGELEQVIEKSKADRQSFESSSYTVFQFTGVYPHKDFDLINLCSNACSSTTPNDELTIIQIKKRMSCKKTHKEQMSDIILCLQKCLNGSNGREVFTADHQLSMHVVARSDLRNFVEIYDEVNKIVSFESLVHYIYVNSIKFATTKSLVALLDSIIEMAFYELKDNIPSLTLRQAEKQDKNVREYQVTIYNCMVKYLSGQAALSYWSGKLRWIHYKYQFSCSETWISKLCLYKEYEKSWMVTLEKELKIYKDAETENTMKYVDRQILPLILPNLIKKVIDGKSTLFIESFEAIFRTICCEYNATINKVDAIKDILENNRGKMEDSIRKYLSMIGFTRYLDSYKHNNFSKIGHKLNQMYGLNSLKIICNTRLKMADLTQLSYILSDIEHVFADEKNHMLYIDMTKLVDPQLFFTDVFTPVLINRASTTSNKINVIGPTYRLKMITKPAHQTDANYVEFFRYGVMKEYNCGKEKRFCVSSRKFGWHNNSSVTSKQIQPKLLQMNLECNNPNNLLTINDFRDNNSQVSRTLKIVLFDNFNSYEILVNPNFTADGIVESLDVSHNLPYQILTNRWNQLFNPKKVNNWIIYDKITSPQFLVALKCYLSTMVQFAELIEIPVIHYDGANDCYLEQVDIPGYDTPITTYNECCTATLLEVNQKLFPQKASGKVAVNHPLVLTYTLVLTRNCGGLIYYHELFHFAKSHGIDAKKLRDVIDALIIDEKHLNVTNDYVFAHFKHECRQIYVHAVIASDAKAYLYIIRDFVEKEYNYFSTYFLLEMHTKCQEDADIRQSIPALQNIVGFEIKICPITVIFITLLRLRIK